MVWLLVLLAEFKIDRLPDSKMYGPTVCLTLWLTIYLRESIDGQTVGLTDWLYDWPFT